MNGPGGETAESNKPKPNKAIQVCALIGGITGFTLMMVLNITTGVVPGGAIGGAIGGGGGAAIGQLIGSLCFRDK